MPCRVLKKLKISDTDVAKNGFEALECLRSEKQYNAILLDISMPDMSGFEVTQIVRSKPDAYGKDHYIIAVTANAMSGDKEECLRARMDDYISKPFTIVQMRHALERVLSTL